MDYVDTHTGDLVMNCMPSEHWQLFGKMLQDLLLTMHNHDQGNARIEVTTAWCFIKKWRRHGAPSQCVLFVLHTFLKAKMKMMV